jgi:hypothetical protein
MGIIRNWAQYTNGTQGAPVETTIALRKELGRKYRDCLNRTGGNHNAAEVELAKEIDLDRKYDAFLTNRLVDSFRAAYQNGALLDFADPVLKGGPERPCQLRNSRTG